MYFLDINIYVSVHRQINLIFGQRRNGVFFFYVSLSTYEQSLSLVHLVNDRSSGVCLVFSLHSMRHKKGHISISTLASIHCYRKSSFPKINLMMTFDGIEWKRENIFVVLYE